jgi:hypothetical protein
MIGKLMTNNLAANYQNLAKNIPKKSNIAKLLLNKTKINNKK